MLHSSWRTSLSRSSMAKKIRYNLNKLGKQIVTPEADWFLYISIEHSVLSRSFRVASFQSKETGA